MQRLFLTILFSILSFALATSAQYSNNFKLTWIEPGSNVVLPAADTF